MVDKKTRSVNCEQSRKRTRKKKDKCDCEWSQKKVEIVEEANKNLEKVGPEGWSPKGGAWKGGALKGGAPKGGAWKGGAPKGGAPKGGEPKISRFFFPLPPQNSFFSSLSGCLLVEFWWCLKRRGR